MPKQHRNAETAGPATASSTGLGRQGPSGEGATQNHSGSHALQKWVGEIPRESPWTTYALGQARLPRNARGSSVDQRQV